MKTSLSISATVNDHSQLNKMLLIAGIISSVFYVAINIIVTMMDRNYDTASQTISELSAIGAPTRTVWVCLAAGYTLLVGAFAWGVVRTAGENGKLRIVGTLLLAYAFTGLFWPFAPMHQREFLAADGGTLTDTMHLVLGGVTVLLMSFAIAYGAAAFGKSFRIYSVVTLLTLIIFGLLTALDAPNVDANLPTPWIGVWERINIGVFLAWIAVLAMALLRSDKFTIELEAKL